MSNVRGFIKEFRELEYRLTSDGEYKTTVNAIQLTYKDTGVEREKEIVKLIFFGDVDSLPKDRAIKFQTPKDSGENLIFHVKDFEKEYTYEVLKEKDTYVHIILRNAVKTHTKINSSLKRNVSVSEPIGFIDTVNPTFEEKEKIYQIGRNVTKHAYVSNMYDSKIMAKHIDGEVNEAEEIIADIKAGGVNKKEFHSRRYKLAQYYIGVYKKWVEFYFDVVLENNLLKKIDSYVSNMEKENYFVTHDDEIIEPYLQKAIRSGHLAFTENKKPISGKVENNAEYTQRYSVAQATQMNGISKPLHKNGEIREETIELLKAISDRKLFHGQINTIEAVLKILEAGEFVANIVGEMGTGKTTMMYLSALAHAKTNVVNGSLKPLKLLMFEPDHLKKSIEQEVLEISGKKVEVIQLESLKQLIKLEKEGVFEDNQDYVFVLSQSNARRKTSKAPYPVYNKRDKTFSCTSCGEVIKKKVRVEDKETKEKIWVMKPVNHLFFTSKKPTKTNRECKKCGELFWAVENKNVESSVFYSKAYGGFVAKDEDALKLQIKILQSKYSNAHGAKKIPIKSKLEQAKKALAEFKGEEKVVRRVSKDASMAQFIFKKMRYKFTHLIADEVHECMTCCG